MYIPTIGVKITVSHKNTWYLHKYITYITSMYPNAEWRAARVRNCSGAFSGSWFWSLRAGRWGISVPAGMYSSRRTPCASGTNEYLFCCASRIHYIVLALEWPLSPAAWGSAFGDGLRVLQVLYINKLQLSHVPPLCIASSSASLKSSRRASNYRRCAQRSASLRKPCAAAEPAQMFVKHVSRLYPNANFIKY